MITRKLARTERIFLSLITATVLFGGIFALKTFGIATDSILLILTAIVSLEIIYLAISIQTLNRNTQSLEEAKKHLEEIKEDGEKTRTSLIYIGHQMKFIQHELDSLKKGHAIKTNGNGHHPKVHI